MINLIKLRSKITHDRKILDKEIAPYIKEIFSQDKIIEKIAAFPIFFVESGGTEAIFKDVYLNYKEPYVIVSKLTNNSLPAALEICSFLKQSGKNFIHLHGTPEDIKNRLANLGFSNKENKKINKLPSVLNNKRYAVIGKPSDWLISSNVDYQFALNNLGVSLIDISFEEFKNEILKASDPTNFDKYSNYLNNKVDKKTLIGALKIYSALKNLIKKYDLDGLTVRCFDLLGSIKNTSCLALAILNQEGIIATCEGDVPAMLTMAYIKERFNQSSFQVNPSYINLKDRYAYFAHCTLPFDMVKEFSFDTHFESGLGIGIKGILDLKDVTILKINPNFTKFECFEGCIESNLKRDDLCRTQIKVIFDKENDAILSDPLGNHLIIFYGHHKQEIEENLI